MMVVLLENSLAVQYFDLKLLKELIAEVSGGRTHLVVYVLAAKAAGSLRGLTNPRTAQHRNGLCPVPVGKAAFRPMCR